jgi:hypothetical protein
METEIRSLFDFIREQHPLAPADALTDALDRLAANIMGRTFGEAYASCLLKGRIPRRLGALMRAYAADV